MEVISKFCRENTLSEEWRKVIMKSVMKDLYQRRVERKCKKPRLNSRQVHELVKEFHSWEDEVEARVKVMLHKYDAPVINERSKQIVALKKLTKQSVYERLYTSTVMGKGLYLRYNGTKFSTSSSSRRQNGSPSVCTIPPKERKSAITPKKHFSQNYIIQSLPHHWDYSSNHKELAAKLQCSSKSSSTSNIFCTSKKSAKFFTSCYNLYRKQKTMRSSVESLGSSTMPQTSTTPGNTLLYFLSLGQ
eukprot:TRINITY_DN13890_c0_g1_i6.p1 TRINITY_DN13890_c0_g1~~TRINITY_DN13890_c0_g1_i6.p1  ORF type:complete len:246 (+),score=38.05 TRINITY_DN13890_c0_g1_i6:344-1081(+)